MDRGNDKERKITVYEERKEIELKFLSKREGEYKK